jgi:hypothetical protein
MASMAAGYRVIAVVVFVGALTVAVSAAARTR